jgi:hypothetical protein
MFKYILLFLNSIFDNSSSSFLFLEQLTTNPAKTTLDYLCQNISISSCVPTLQSTASCCLPLCFFLKPTQTPFLRLVFTFCLQTLLLSFSFPFSLLIFISISIKQTFDCLHKKTCLIKRIKNKKKQARQTSNTTSMTATSTATSSTSKTSSSSAAANTESGTPAGVGTGSSGSGEGSSGQNVATSGAGVSATNVGVINGAGLLFGCLLFVFVFFDLIEVTQLRQGGWMRMTRWND